MRKATLLVGLLLCNTVFCQSIDECTPGATVQANCGPGTCTELTEGFSCECNTGYTSVGGYPLTTCVNIDECDSGAPVVADCGLTGTCLDQPGGFTCQCQAGYKVTGGYPSTTCSDIDECDELESVVAECGTNGSCDNTTGGFDCICHSGYETSGSYPLTTCTNIDECANGGVADCGTGTCVDSDGTFTCVCPLGYELETGAYPAGITCVDIDECNNGDADCGPGTCENTTGGFTCSCNLGYESSQSYPITTCVDIDDCNTEDCGSNGTCNNADGDYSCTCNAGYEQTGTYPSITCSDINECAGGGVANCNDAVGATCDNNDGGFTCSCPVGYESVNDYPDTTCVDIDECDENASTVAACGDNGTCVNNAGGFSCECNQGFLVAAEYPLTQCININECEEGAIVEADCGDGHQCVDVAGSYNCVCQLGYYATTGYPRITCANMDECSGDDAVVANCGTGSCVDSQGGYSCDCPIGFEESGVWPSITCVDIDECGGVADCGNGSCANTSGGFDCVCNDGYESFGSYPETTCINIDECDVLASVVAVCGSGTCVDNDGEFSCNCQQGYEETHEYPHTQCSNIDECDAGASIVADCGVGHTCVDTFGGFSCTCLEGYESVGAYPLTTCQNIDECTDVTKCGTGGTCVDTAGAYSCICEEGYIEDGPYPFTTCITINECEVDSIHEADCGQGTCADYGQYFECICDDGYVMTGTYPSITCTDIDECSVGAVVEANCGQGVCTNTDGGFTCACETGYESVHSYPLTQCVNINECEVGASFEADCGTGTCVDHNGGFVCQCPDGYEEMGTYPSITCANIDECTVGATVEADCGPGNCVDNDGAFSCECNEGYEETGVWPDNTCTNVDECNDADANTGNCGNGSCVDSDGAFTCDCDTGYQSAGTYPTITCVDIDDCFADAGRCVNGVCTNTDGAYTCDCDVGYESSGTYDTITCINIDECDNTTPAIVTAACGPGACVDNDGAFDCTCNTGYEVMGEYPVTTCVDTDECDVDAASNPCIASGDNSGVCTNTDGAYTCDCSAGYEFDGTTCINIDECIPTAAVVADCGEGTCVDADGDFSCTCNEGYVESGTYPLTTCTNINECDVSSVIVAGCGNGVCVDHDGGFTCVCDLGYEFTGEYPVATCTNLDECAADTDICGDDLFGGVYPSANSASLGVCVDNDGSYTCTCDPGTSLETNDASVNNGIHYSGTRCQVQDLCSVSCDNLYGTGENFLSHNVGGGCYCSCFDGFEFDNGVCFNLNQAYKSDECAQVTTDAYAVSHLCSEHGVLANCAEDVNGFSVSTAVTNDCINNADSVSQGWACPSPGEHAGDYSCYCNAGYRATAGDDGATCANVDECADGVSATGTVDCGPGSCVDNEGSYTCNCEVGYELNGDATTCINIDECTVNPAICDTGLYLGPYPSTVQNVLGACQDTDGSYFCECSHGNEPADFLQTSCVDIDECDAGTCTNGVFVDPWWNLGNDDGSHDFAGVSRCYCACQEPFNISNGFCTNIDQGHSSDECQSIDDNNEGEWELCDDGNVGQYYADGALTPQCTSKSRDFCGVPPDCGTVCFTDDCSDTGIVVLPGDVDLNMADSGNANLARAISVRPGCTMTVYKDMNHIGHSYTEDNTSGVMSILTVLGDLTDNYVDEVESYECTCPGAGLVGGASGRRRRDADPLEWNCVDTPFSGTTGRFKCKCNVGYGVTNAGDALEDGYGHNTGYCGDIDECTAGVSATEVVDCGAGTCVNTEGSYTCDCPIGYELHSNGLTCIDINECDIETDGCEGYTCINSEGSYTCDCSREGSVCGSPQCVACHCKVGFRKDADGICIDIDECSEDNSLCENGTCNNTSGDYFCECDYGFNSINNMKGCEDADECFTLVHECPVHTDCINRPGGYVCVQTTCEVPADYELCPAPSTPCGTIKVGNIATDTYDFVLDVETGSANMPVELAGISNVLIVQPYCNLAIHADFDNFAGGFNCENMSNGESKICYTGSGHHSYTCECDASMTPTDPSWCNFHVGEMMEVEGEDCGLVHCVDNASGFNCACFDPIDPKAWSVQKLVLSTDMGWAQETVEGAKAKCASMGYEINEIRYKYQFTDMVDHFGIEKLDNVWAGMKFSEMTEYEIPGWVTELTDELVNFRTTDKDVWHATEPSNNDEDEHALCAQFMDGKLDDSYCELKKDFVCYNTPESKLSV